MQYTKDQIMETLQSYADKAQAEGYKVYAIMLKGSQNYNLPDEESDIDANLIYIPTIAQMRSPEVPKFTFEDGEVTCHSIYKFAEIVAKGNPQWIEVCHTDYHIGGSLEMFKHFKLNPSALKGMLMEKVHAFDRLYPSRKKYIEQFGYDPKQLHHIIRLYDCLNEGVLVKKYYGAQRDFMMAIKRGGTLTKEEAFELRDKYVALLQKIYESRKMAYTPQKINYGQIDQIVLENLCHNYK